MGFQSFESRSIGQGGGVLTRVLCEVFPSSSPPGEVRTGRLTDVGVRRDTLLPLVVDPVERQNRSGTRDTLYHIKGVWDHVLSTPRPPWVTRFATH